MTKLRIILAILISMTFISCAALNFNSPDSNTLVLAYASGKAMGFSIQSGVKSGKISKEADEGLTKAWESFKERNKEVEVIPGSEVMLLYNECLMILTRETNDPYGLIGDLGVLLTIYGARYSEEGSETKTMIFVQDVHKLVLFYFENGYLNGKAVVT